MELVEIIERVDALKKEIDELRPLDAFQKERIMQKFRLDWNYHSNAIEGNSLSLSETRIFLLHGITAKGKPFKDYLDIKGHNEAIRFVEQIVRDAMPLTEAAVREIHKILLIEPYEVEAITPDGLPTKRIVKLGEYKTAPNHVRTRTGEIFFFASPEETPAAMGDLMAWYKKEKGELHPLILAATFHYRFVRIHPFDDGNGRMARLLMNLILMQFGFPPVVIQIDARDNEYYPALEMADAGDLSPFIELIGRGLIHSLELYVRGAKGEDIEELGDLDKRLTLLKRQLDSEEQAIMNQKMQTQNHKKNFVTHYIIPFFRRLTHEIEKFKTLAIKVFVYEWGNPNSRIPLPTDLQIREQALQKVFDNVNGVEQVPVSYVLTGGRLTEEINIIVLFKFNEDKVDLHFGMSNSLPRAERILKELDFSSKYDEGSVLLIQLITDEIYKTVEKMLVKEKKND